MSSSNDNPLRASFLGIPGEMCKRIYREALVKARPIAFSSLRRDGPPAFTTKYVRSESKTTEPGIVRVCNLIRHEARPIFLYGNTFVNHIMDGQLAPQVRHWFWEVVKADSENKKKQKQAKRSNYEIEQVGNLTWSSLMVWLEAYWKGELEMNFVEVFDGDVHTEYYQAQSAFQLVEELRGVEWTKVKSVLGIFSTSVDIAADLGATLNDDRNDDDGDES